MKKSFKKSLALLLSALMVVSMLPAFAVTASASEWKAVASNNLSDSHWSWVDRHGSDGAWGWAMLANTNNDDQNDLKWSSVQYYDWGDLDNGHIGNGYLYLNESTTPITGSDSFKIDIEFKFTDNFEITNNGGSSNGGADFLILTTNDNCDWFNGDAKSNYVFKQSGYGNLSFNSGATSDNSNTSESYRIATNNPNIDVNSTYHYVLTYANGTIAAVVKDASGNTVIDYGSHNDSINTSDIKNIVIGITNGTDASYNYQNISYQNVNFYTRATVDDFDASKLATPSFAFAPKHEGSDINSNFYSNVVYASHTSWDGNGTANNSYIGIGRMDFKIATPYETVLVYDGDRETSYPVILEQHRNQSSGQSQLIHYMGSYGELGGFELQQDWAGGDTVYNQWPTGSDSFAYYNDNNYNESDNLNNDNNHFYANKMVYYLNSGDTTNYYSVVSNQNYYGQTSYKESTGSRQYKYGDVKSYSKQYVINYQPIYSILADARDLATEITTNAWKYTPESIAAAKYALYLVGDCNPNNYDFASGVGAAVKECATDIKNARAAYDAINLVKKEFTATFKAANGSTIETRPITAGDALGALPANTAGVTHNAGTNTHTAYTWNGVATAETVITENTEFTETTGSFDCTFEDVHTPATDALNGYTDKVCSACGNVDDAQRVYDAQDFTAYDAAVADYEDVIAAADYTAKYTAASREAYEAAVVAAEIDKTAVTLSPKAIADAASAISAAKSNLGIATYTVTYEKADATNSTEDFAYGTEAATVAAAAPALPANYFDDEKHYSYAWDTAFADVTGAVTYTQVETAEEHSYTSAYTAATAETNGFTTYTCDCGRSYVEYDAQDFTAYDNAVAAYAEDIAAADYTAKYTEASRNAYAAAATAVLDKNDEELSPAAIAAATKAITDAKAALEVQEYTVTFVKADSTSTSADFAYGTEAATVAAAAPALPANYFDDEKHYSYAWDTAFADVTAAATYTQVETAADHVYTDVHTEATAEKNGFTTYTCACGHSYVTYDAQDFTAYDAAVEEAEALKVNEAYTAESRTAYAQAVDAAKLSAAQLADTSLSPTAIAAATEAIEAAKSNLEAVPDEPEDTYNLTITDDIDINFNIDTEYQDAEEGYITVEYVEINKNEISTETKTETIDATGAQTSISMTAIPAQIAEPYKITVYNKDGDVIREFEQSVVDYCNAVINSNDPAITDKDKEVAKGILDYGAAANAYFDYANLSETENYAVSHSADYNDYVAALDTDDIKSKAHASFSTGADASGENIYVTGVSYLALIEPEFRFYVSQTNEVWAAKTDVTITDLSGDSIDGVTAEMVKTSNGNCVRVTGLKASDFGKSFKIMIGEAKLEYNGYAFLYTALTSTTIDENMQNLAKGVYRYAAACEEKFA